VNISDGYLQRGWTARGREIGKIPQDSNLVISRVYFSLISGLGLAMIGKSYPTILKFMILPVPGKISQLLGKSAMAPINSLSEECEM
jgi:hypothetical protein